MGKRVVYWRAMRFALRLRAWRRTRGRVRSHLRPFRVTCDNGVPCDVRERRVRSWRDGGKRRRGRRRGLARGRNILCCCVHNLVRAFPARLGRGYRLRPTARLYTLGAVRAFPARSGPRHRSAARVRPGLALTTHSRSSCSSSVPLTPSVRTLNDASETHSREPLQSVQSDRRAAPRRCTNSSSSAAAPRLHPHASHRFPLPDTQPTPILLAQLRVS
jgi:hypothetical protein